MKALELINPNETPAPPYASVASCEAQLARDGYLAVKDGTRFIGLVTETDVIDKAHTLVIDCVGPKRFVRYDDGIEEALSLMRTSGVRFLPVADREGNYAGTISIESVLSALSSIRRSPTRVTITNEIGSREAEACKQSFVRQLTHCVKNPLQVIHSSLSLLRDGAGEREAGILLDTIASCAKDIDEVVERLADEYLRGVPSG